MTFIVTCRPPTEVDKVVDKVRVILAPDLDFPPVRTPEWLVCIWVEGEVEVPTPSPQKAEGINPKHVLWVCARLTKTHPPAKPAPGFFQPV
jgi:hypothetical protein